MGALMGGGVGLTIGFIFGSYSILRYATLLTLLSSHLRCPSYSRIRTKKRGGAGPRGFLATLSQYMLSSAATFSFFLAIGSVRLHLTHPFSPPLTLGLSPSHFTSPNSQPRFALEYSSLTRCPRSSETIPSCHHILKPRDSRCSLLLCVLVLTVPH